MSILVELADNGPSRYIGTAINTLATIKIRLRKVQIYLKMKQFDEPRPLSCLRQKTRGSG